MEGGPWDRKGMGPLLRSGAFRVGLHGLEKAPLLSCLWGPYLPAEVLERQRGRSARQLGGRTACPYFPLKLPAIPSPASPPSAGPLAAEPLPGTKQLGDLVSKLSQLSLLQCPYL